MKKTVLIIIGIWFFITAFFVLANECVFLFGKEVLLKTTPFDPRDILRGDYINLKFEISEIKDKNHNLRGRYIKAPVYVILETDENNIAHASDITLIKPKNVLFIKGRQNYRYGENVEIKYGIESYFIKQKTGGKLEKELSKGALSRVKIDIFGNAKLVEIIK